MEEMIALLSDVETLKEVKTITDDFYRIAINIRQLESLKLKASESIEIIEDIRNHLKTKPGIPQNIIKRFDDVFSEKNNPGFVNLRSYFESGNVVEPITSWDDGDLTCIENIKLTSSEIERAYSVYSAMFRSNRRKFKIENFLQYVITKCILQKV